MTIAAQTVHDSAIVRFSRMADSYDDVARAQRWSAARLIDLHHGRIASIVDGDVLEIGCGTGLLTELLANTHAVRSRQFTVTDASPNMVSKCRTALGGYSNLQFETLDASAITKKNGCALIASSFVLQWLDLEQCLPRLLDALVPGGVFLFAVPSASSFIEWRNACAAAGSDFTGNELPTAASIARAAGTQHEIQIIEETLRVRYERPLEFFNELRGIGADFRLGQNASGGNLVKTIRWWQRELGDRPCHITFSVLFGLITRG